MQLQAGARTTALALTSPLGAQKPDHDCAHRTSAGRHASGAIANRSSALRACPACSPYTMLFAVKSSICSTTMFYRPVPQAIVPPLLACICRDCH